MSATAFLDVRDISVVFGGLKAVNGLSFQVEQGRIHALIGPNGAGKSTTFNCISRFYTPSSGSVTFEGQELTRVSPHRMASLGIARTFQNLELFAELSVLENVLLGTHARAANTIGRLLRRPGSETEDFAMHLLERVGLADERHQPARDLDFGRQKLLELARALAIKPKLLLLDEPAAGLRNREIESLDRLLKELVARDGITVLLVEHVMQLVMSISDRITVMAFGEKIAEAMYTVGNGSVNKDSVITVEESNTFGVDLEVTEGLRFDKGYISGYFATDMERQEAVLEDPYILLVSSKISNIRTTPAGPAAARPKPCIRPMPTASAPSAMAFTTSVPRQILPSTTTSDLLSMASTISGRTAQEPRP